MRMGAFLVSDEHGFATMDGDKLAKLYPISRMSMSVLVHRN